MKRQKRQRKIMEKESLQREAAKTLNRLLQRTRPQGKKIPVERDPIEPDQGERL